MADKKPRQMSVSDIEFFRRELKSREPSQLTLITGTGDEAQKVLRDMIDAGASIQDGKLSVKHESAVDGIKMKIEQSIRIEESIAQGSAMPGMTLRARNEQMKRQTDRKKFIDLRIADDMSQIDYVGEVKRAIDTSDLKKHIDEIFQKTDFSVKEFRTEDYPEKSQAYLIEAEFYCRKAREYRAKELTAATKADSYIERGIGSDATINEQYKQVSEMYRKVEMSYSEVFYYCIQEAVYWKIKAEIYNNSEQDKKRIQDPTKSSSCKIHSENDVTKYVYIPTDKKNIEEAKIDLELTKVGLGARSGVDNVMLVVKGLEECKREDTFNMMSKLSFHGGEFKERGMVMVTEDRKLINDRERTHFSEAEEQHTYFRKEARKGYSSILKIAAEENRVFSFNKKRIDENFYQEREDRRAIDNFRKIRNSAEVVRHTTKGVKYQSELTDTGMNMYKKIDILNDKKGIQVDKITNQVVINVFTEGQHLMHELRRDERRYVNSELKREEALGTIFIIAAVVGGGIGGAGGATAGGFTGVTVGATLGMVAGPPGAILGGVLGGAAGVVVGGVGGAVVGAVYAVGSLFKKKSL